MKLRFKDPHLHYVSLTCIIHRKGKYLITKRSPKEKAFPNIWTVPGGKVNVNDYINTKKTTSDAWYKALERSLKREVKEEVSLEIKNVRYLIDMTFIRPDNIPVVVLSYYADYKSGKVKLDEDSIEYKWIYAKEVQQYDLISGIGEEVIMVDKIKKGVNPNKFRFIPRKK